MPARDKRGEIRQNLKSDSGMRAAEQMIDGEDYPVKSSHHMNVRKSAEEERKVVIVQERVSSDGNSAATALYKKQFTMPLSSQSEDKEVRESKRQGYYDETESALTPPVDS